LIFYIYKVCKRVRRRRFISTKSDSEKLHLAYLNGSVAEIASINYEFSKGYYTNIKFLEAAA